MGPFTYTATLSHLTSRRVNQTQLPQISAAFPHLRKSTLSNSPFALKDFTTKGFHDVSSCFNRAQYISAFCQVDVKSLPGGGLQVAYRAIPFGNDFPVAYWAICVCLNKSLQISAWF